MNSAKFFDAAKAVTPRIPVEFPAGYEGPPIYAHALTVGVTRELGKRTRLQGTDGTQESDFNHEELGRLVMIHSLRYEDGSPVMDEESSVQLDELAQPIFTALQNAVAIASGQQEDGEGNV